MRRKHQVWMSWLGLRRRWRQKMKLDQGADREGWESQKAYNARNWILLWSPFWTKDCVGNVRQHYASKDPFPYSSLWNVISWDSQLMSNTNWTPMPNTRRSLIHISRARTCQRIINSFVPLGTALKVLSSLSVLLALLLFPLFISICIFNRRTAASNESKVDGKYGGWVTSRAPESDDAVCATHLFSVDSRHVNTTWPTPPSPEPGGIHHASVSVWWTSRSFTWRVSVFLPFCLFLPSSLVSFRRHNASPSSDNFSSGIPYPPWRSRQGCQGLRSQLPSLHRWPVLGRNVGQASLSVSLSL